MVIEKQRKNPMTKKLSGKVALVTGGSRGIGAASARALANEGANVAISYVASADKAEAVVAELKASGVQARAYKADQASSVEVDQLVKDVARDFGRLDILVNNAGVAVGGPIDNANTDTAALARQDASRDLGPRGTAVNVLQPGSINTDMNPDDDREFAEAQRTQHALQRYGTAEEIAAGVVFLTSPEASFVTGTVLNIDGGFGA